jgi:cbb3-type cytochrome oxidase subunit 1
MATLGIALGLLPLVLGGIVQGRNLLDANVAFVDVAKSTLMFLRLSTIGDFLILLGHLLLLVNFVVLAIQLARIAFQAFFAAAISEVETVGVKS